MAVKKTTLKAGKPAKAKASKTSSLVSKAVSAGKSLLSGGSKPKGRSRGRRKSPEYWAKKVLVEKLKKRYFKLKYGSR